MIPKATLRKALNDPGLLGTSLEGESWHAWRTLLLAIMGEALTDAELVTFQRLTGRDAAPLERVEEFVGVIGRRGGKSRAMGVLGAYIAALCDHSSKLAAGERGLVLLIAPDQKQSRVLLGYVEGALRSSPRSHPGPNTRNALSQQRHRHRGPRRQLQAAPRRYQRRHYRR